MASVSSAAAEITSPPLAHLNSRSSRRNTAVFEGRLVPGSEVLNNPFEDLTRTDTVDFADGGVR
jgi:hypothetical protein